MLVNQNRVLLVVIGVVVGCLVNMPQMKLKDPMMKAGVFAACLYVAYWFLNSQGLVEGATKWEWTDTSKDEQSKLDMIVANYNFAPSSLTKMAAACSDIGKGWCTQAGKEDCKNGNEKSWHRVLATFGDSIQVGAEQAAVARCENWMREGYWLAKDPNNDGTNLCGSDS
jgi:hypothetical protein